MPDLPLDGLDGVVFDTDGVLTDTDGVHAAAWAGLFDGYLARRAARLGGPWRPFTHADYLTPERLRVQLPATSTHPVQIAVDGHLVELTPGSTQEFRL